MSLKYWKRRIIAFVLPFVMVVIPFDMSVFSSPTQDEGQYIVTFKNQNVKEKFVKEKNKKKKIKKDFEQQTSVAVELTESELAELSANSDILYVEPDSEIEILTTGKPDKNDKAVQKMQKGTQEVPWGIADVVGTTNLNKYDGKNVKVAIFDTGISNHEDLTISGGISFVDYTQSYADDNGHGTHVAGTIAANNNKLGVIGIAPDAEIYAVKILNQNGGGNYSNIIAALEWAIANKIDIINMSLGGNQYSMALHEAVQRAVNAGIIIVAAAGNNGIGENTLTYPARYPEVVAVGAVGKDYKVANYSSKGSDLNIVAPGTAILSTLNDGTYAVLSGTSMAAPHVAGALAALKSKNKKMTSFELVNRIYETATSLGDYNSYGYGLLNFAYAAGEINGPIISVPVEDIPGEDNNNEDEEIIEPTPVPENLPVEQPITQEPPIPDIEYNPDLFILDPPNENGEVYIDTVDMFYGDIEAYNEVSVNTYPEPILPDYDISNEIPYEIANDIRPPLEVQAELDAMYNADDTMEILATPTITVSSVSQTSISVKVVYPTSTAWGNLLNCYDWTNAVRTYITPPSSWTTTTYYNVTDGTYTKSGLEPGRKYTFTMGYYQNSTWYYIEVHAFTTFKTPQITVSNIGTTTATFSTVFPCPTSDNNYLYFYDSGTYGGGYDWTNHVPRVPDPAWKTKDGTYNVTNLVPNNTYKVKLRYYRDDLGQWQETIKTFTTSASSGTTTINSGGKVSYTVPSYLSSKITSTLINNVDASFDAMQDLVGGQSSYGNSFKLLSTRDLGVGIIAEAGDPIYPIKYKEGFLNEHLLYLSYYNNTMVHAILHEMGHNFDSNKWNFESEFCAELKTAYILDTKGYRVTLGRYTYQGLGDGVGSIRYMYKSHPGGRGYDYCMANNVYDSSALIYRFLKIKESMIDWEPFKKTFRYFNSIADTTIQSLSNLDKLNLFLTKLRDYSGVDVIAQFTEKEKDIYGKYFGGTNGTITYYTVTILIDDHSNYVNKGTTLNEGIRTNGTINYANDIDCFAFTAPATDKYTIISNGGTSVYGNLWTLNGNSYQYVYPISGGSATEDNNFQDMYNFTQGITYYLEIRHTSSTASSGNYTIMVSRDDYGDFGGNATQLLINNAGINSMSNTQSSLLSDDMESLAEIAKTYKKDGQYDGDSFEYTPQYTGKYVFYSTGNLDTYCLIKYKPVGTYYTFLEEGDSGGAGNNFKITVELIKNTKYTFIVGGITTSYPSVPATIYLEYYDDHLNDFNTTLTSLSINTTYNCSLYPNDIDCFKFTPTIDGVYKIFSTGTTDVMATLYDSNKTTELYSIDDAPSNTNNGVNFVLPYTMKASKTYYIKVQASPDAPSYMNAGDYTIKAENIATPTDPSFKNSQWGLYNTGQDCNGLTGNAGLDGNIVPTWEYSTGSGITVAVIDTGTQITHEDLTNQWVPGKSTAFNSSDVYPANEHIYTSTEIPDFETREAKNSKAASRGHGTLVAGIIAAQKGNSKGVSGIAPDAKIMPIKVMGTQLDTTPVTPAVTVASAISDGMTYAINNGAKILNCSFVASDNSQMKNVILNNPNVLFVAGAGNGEKDASGIYIGIDIGSTGKALYPASYAYNNVIAVAAVDGQGNLGIFSNYGGTTAVAAPGVNIYSTFTSPLYKYEDGTSLATPYVSGVAALVWSKYPTLTAAKVKSRIVNNVRKLNTLSGKVSSGGMVDAFYALCDYGSTNAVSAQSEVNPPKKSEKEIKKSIIDTMATTSDELKTSNVVIDFKDELQKVEFMNNIHNYFLNCEFVRESEYTGAVIIKFNTIEEAEDAVITLNSWDTINYAELDYIVFLVD